MAFVAAEAAVELEYDFTGMITVKGKGKQRVRGWPEDLYEVKGVTPEPSQQQVREFQESLRKLYKLGEFAPGAQDGDGDKVSGDELAAAVNKSLSLTELTEQDKQVAAIYAAVCSDEPSAEQIRALPHRARAGFIGYLSQELLNPTAGSPDTNASRAPLRSV